jgi:hypothetical protein
MTRLRTSGARVFTALDAYCSEGADDHHQLREGDQVIPDGVQPCHSISSAEIVGDDLWLGTRIDGEGATLPADGVLVQPLEGAGPSRWIGKEQGLTGNLIRAIRRDPYRETTWVVSDRGFNEIDSSFNLKRTRYFYEAFDPISGEATLFLGASPHQSDPFAVLGRALHIADPVGYHAAVRGLSAEARAGLDLMELTLSSRFLPEEMNVLVPFLLPLTRSPERQVAAFSVRLLCRFKDARVLPELRSLEAEPASPPNWEVKSCLDRYTELGLLDPSVSSERAAVLLENERAALERIRGARADEHASYGDIQAVIEAAQSLKKLGSSEGIEMLNRYFRDSYGRSRDSEFLETVTQHMYEHLEIAPSVLIGLRRFDLARIGRGCQFFNNELASIIGARYEVIYAEVLLLAVERIREHESSRAWTRVPDHAVRGCSASLAAQLRDSGVRQAFMAHVYPTLSDAQRQIVDPMLH